MRRTVVTLLAAATFGVAAAGACEAAPSTTMTRVDPAPDPMATASLPGTFDWRADLDRIEVAFRRTLPEIERLTDPAE
ncbi:hypothetical protein [Oharaeibacter diazotrophicus]|uniref:Uncharacterized protein n=1 Tax=Oharaeibacter diazotrophicus TaxID=1920512 RepID=A0A4R6RAN9_9HYPH|nr:hypothetical protein [Oharaeibacter diazotrophicus]TDP83170.1 hypothetical protein EDD54_3127 [Oharaeibacter diazotrophicus]BBE71999.1 hypothetical protein OHA_1_01586 [Pleomorphomonas sp. SM30]GLS78764.1 hypothetical protein GCM10007904_41010 [Oharaeibacter diazotrophicus]